MENTVVIGAQWGDEGKAKITDLLAEKADLIIRYQGGCNAGHTVVAGGKTYKFHMIPSGILYDKTICFIGAGTVIHPESFERELNELKAEGVNFKNLKISPLASITMPYHIEIDGYSEAHSGKGKIGTTKKGIGPTYTDKAARIGFKIQDLYSFEALNEKIDMILSAKNKMLKNVYGLEDKKILFEGAQGVMLDVDYGTYPFVTSSNPIGGGAAVGSGYGPAMIKEVVGVSKAYVTRVGEGPFVTELTNETGKMIQDIGHEFGVTTGRPRRCGWFDSVIMKYAVLVGGITKVALTKIDVFDTFDEIKICTAYKDCRNDKVYTTYPTDVFIHKYLEPIYETVPGWKTPISSIRKYEDLPENAKKYIEKVEDLIGAPIGIISVGPDREQTIFR